MIFELLMGAGLVIAGAATARVMARRRDEDEGADGPPTSKDRQEKKTPRSGPRPRFEKRTPAGKATGPRGLRVQDVLLYADTELWLAGAIELQEEGLVARLFPTPGGLRADWVAQLDEEARDVVTLQTTDEVPAGAVPEALPIGGRRLTLERRGDADVTVTGEHVPRVGRRGRYTILSDAGGRVLIVVDFDKAPRIALLGDRVESHMLDLLPGGDLED